MCIPSKMKSIRRMALVSVPFIWGSYAPLTKYILHDSTTLIEFCVLNSLSSCIAAAIFAVPFFHQLPMYHLSWQNVKESATIGVWLFCGQLFQVIGLLHTSAATNAIMVQMSCVFVAIHHFFQNYDPTRLAVSTLAAVGGYLVGMESSDSDDTWIGILFCMIAAVFYAIHTISVGYCEEDSFVQSSIQLGVMFLLNSLVIHAILFWNAHLKLRHIHNGNASWLLVWNSVFGTAWTTFAMSFAQQEIDASTSAIAYASEPAFAMIISFFVFERAIGPIQWVALVMIIASNVLSAQDPKLKHIRVLCR